MPTGGPSDPSPAWSVVEDGAPVVACAIHAGQDLRPEVQALMALGRRDRLYEEDSYTGELTEVAGTRLVVHRSRFELDLNRARHLAVYREPGEAWGLHVWRTEPPAPMLQRSLALYDRFYRDLAAVLTRAGVNGRPFVVCDLHSYNHRRGGPDAPAADPARHPEINVGTASLDRRRWGPLVDRFIGELRSVDFLGRRLDVRENVRFRGGHLSRWVHSTFPGQGCALAVEVKKFFMDEHSGELNAPVWAALREALDVATAGLREELEGRQIALRS
jgi:N-formylglutamate amidohydrolase